MLTERKASAKRSSRWGPHITGRLGLGGGGGGGGGADLMGSPKFYDTGPFCRIVTTCSALKNYFFGPFEAAVAKS